MKRIIASKSKSRTNMRPDLNVVDVIEASEDTGSEALDTAIGNLKADFDYAISGLEALGRSGVNSSNEALAIAENIGNSLKQFISDIADAVSE